MKFRNFSNFFGCTIANWEKCEIPDRDPDYISFTGSAYWDFGNKIRRCSDHWGKLRTSIWFLDCKSIKTYSCGECYYSEFRELTKEILESLSSMEQKS